MKRCKICPFTDGCEGQPGLCDDIRSDEDDNYHPEYVIAYAAGACILLGLALLIYFSWEYWKHGA